MMRADADGHAPVEGAQRGLVAPAEPYGGGAIGGGGRLGLGAEAAAAGHAALGPPAVAMPLDPGTTLNTGA